MNKLSKPKLTIPPFSRRTNHTSRIVSHNRDKP